MDRDVLTSLLKGGHLNVEQRINKGLWPHPPLKYAEVLEHLVGVIEKQEWFPADMSMPREGVLIQNIQGSFICHCLNAGPTSGQRVNDYKFNNAKDAAHFYLKYEMNLPGDLDGWKVE